MRRVAVCIMVSLLAGAAVNVAMAWGCAAWAPATLFWNSAGYPVEPADRAWIEASGWRPPPGDEALTLRTISLARGFGREAAEIALIGEIAPTREFTEVEGIMGFDDVASVSRSGWPLLSLAGGRLKPMGLSSDPDRMIDLVDLSGAGRLVQFPERGIPMWPIWPRFAVDTVGYGAALWLIVAAPGVVRRRRRIRRGQCGHCAYPVSASALCTECGSPVRTVTVRSHFSPVRMDNAQDE